MLFRYAPPFVVTGAGGSIGAALCQRLLELGAEVIGVARSEESLLRIPAGALAILGSVTDRWMLDGIMRNVGTVFHCAAHKHVNICEINPTEAQYNNVFGTMQVLRAAEDAGVANFVFLSTDKAYKPTSVYGRTKRDCERLVLSSLIPNPKIVRLCNVIGSSGSVIPIWEKQIAAGGPVTVSSAEATRYFIDMNDAVNFLLDAPDYIRIGPHTPDWVKPTRIIDLARATIAARTPYAVEIKITGLRPGERLHETLTTAM